MATKTKDNDKNIIWFIHTPSGEVYHDRTSTVIEAKRSVQMASHNDKFRKSTYSVFDDKGDDMIFPLCLNASLDDLRLGQGFHGSIASF